MPELSLEEQIATLRELVDAIYERDPKWKQSGEWPKGHDTSIWHPPASDAAIEKHQKRTNRRFPPSYRQFLLLHNGCEHFWLDFSLMGVSGRHTTQVSEEIRESEAWHTESTKRTLGDTKPGTIANWEAEDETNLFLPMRVKPEK